MLVSEAQADMRSGYLGGAPGVFASSISWWAAAGVAWFMSPSQGMLTLVIAGMLIHPLGMLIAKVLGARGAHSKGNPLAEIAAANTFWLIFGIVLAYLASLQRIEWFFSAMLLMIGGRYLTFAPMYGMRFYWVIGLVLAGAGLATGMLLRDAALVAAIGASIELVGAVAAFVLSRESARASTAD
ncbi:MAG: hypothetical protein RIR33_1190 [Pseudomonadota bacterium]|jgi:hypothetical protein